MMTFVKMKMPVYWASYLINGDASGLEPGEADHIERYLSKEGVRHVLDVSDEPHFTHYYAMYGGRYDAGEVVEYTVELDGVA
jgi:hypothetical protein